MNLQFASQVINLAVEVCDLRFESKFVLVLWMVSCEGSECLLRTLAACKNLIVAAKVRECLKHQNDAFSALIRVTQCVEI